VSEVEVVHFVWKSARWVWNDRERAHSWLVAATGCGLTEMAVRKTLGWNWALEGRAGPLHVRLDSLFPGDDPLATDITIRGLSAGLDGPSSDPLRWLGGVDLDAETLRDMPPVSGPALLLCAVMDGPTRRLVRNLFAGRLDIDGAVQTWTGTARLRDGRLSASFLPGSGSFAPTLTDVLAALLDIARRLLPPEDMARAAARNAQSDPDPGVRIHHLRTVRADAKDPQLVQATYWAALADPAAEVRLEAALACGPEGVPVLRAMVADEQAPDRCRARAVRLLRAELPTDLAEAALVQALGAHASMTALACIELLQVRHPPSIDAIVPTAEPALVDALTKEADVRVAAAEALGRIGTATAVLPRQEAARAHPGDGALRQVVRESVAAIQGRLPGSSPGQLALAEGASGQISVAEDPRGRVAMPDEPEGGSE